MNQADLLRFAIKVLDEHSVPYLLVGSLASGAYGEYRQTADIDIVIELTLGKVGSLCAAFPDPEFYVSPTAAHSAVMRGGQFNIIHPTSGNKIDFMISRRDAWGREQLRRRREEWIFPDLRGYLAAPEDIILSKLLYYQEGEHEKHLRDIGSMLRISPELIDQEYIREWAVSLGVQQEWQVVLDRLRSA